MTIDAQLEELLPPHAEDGHRVVEKTLDAARYLLGSGAKPVAAFANFDYIEERFKPHVIGMEAWFFDVRYLVNAKWTGGELTCTIQEWSELVEVQPVFLRGAPGQDGDQLNVVVKFRNRSINSEDFIDDRDRWGAGPNEQVRSVTRLALDVIADRRLTSR